MAENEENKNPKATEDVEAEKPVSSTTRSSEEIGGSKGPEPTRFGDWEKGGRCIDF